MIKTYYVSIKLCVLHSAETQKSSGAFAVRLKLKQGPEREDQAQLAHHLHARAASSWSALDVGWISE